MSNDRTNSLMAKLPVELRRRVECDLVDKPPGRETYEKVYEFYALGYKGISKSALGRYGGWLRTQARNLWIRQTVGVSIGRDVSEDIEGMIRGQLFEALATDNLDVQDLRRAAHLVKLLTEAKIRVAQLETLKTAALDAVSKAETTADPEEARAKLASEIRAIYGLGDAV